MRPGPRIGGPRIRAGRALRSACACLVLVEVAFSDPTWAQETIVRGEAAQRVDDFLSRLTALGFSGSVVLAQETAHLLKGYGEADRETGRLVTPATVFTVGSLTKQFTGAAILSLEMQGKLRVQDPIGKYLEGVPADKQEITLHHLLTHTSGLKDVFGDDFDVSATRESLLRRILSSELLEHPGAAHAYSNAGYSLLGMIIEIVAGTGYEAYLQEQLFKPAGMKRTGYLAPDYQEDELAVGYSNDERWGTVLQRPMLEDGPSWNLRANGGLHSTPEDMWRWHQALEAGRVLSAEARRKYEAPHVDEGGGDTFYGYGWVNVETDRNTRLLWHDGSNSIFSADCRRYMDEETFLFVTSSDPAFPANEVAEVLDSVIFGDHYVAPPLVSSGPANPARFAGSYRLRPGDTLSVATTSGGLEVSADGCWAEYLVAGGSGELDPNANGLRQQTLDILMATKKGDFEPLRNALPEGARGERMTKQMHVYWDRQIDESGALQSAEVARCVPFEGHLKVVVRMDHTKGTWYRSLRWRNGSLAGYGLHAALPGGPKVMTLYPVSERRFEAYYLGTGSSTELGFELPQSDVSAPPRLTLRVDDWTVHALRRP